MLLFVEDELSFDRFHHQADRVYRLTEMGRSTHWACMQGPISPMLFDGEPGVTYARIWPQRHQILGWNDRRFNGDVMFTDPGFFAVFSFPLLQGDSKTALVGGQKAVLTRSMAHKLFGDRSPIGETIAYNERFHWEVTGVVADPPSNSHLQFEVLASFESVDQFTTARTGRGPDASGKWASERPSARIGLC